MNRLLNFARRSLNTLTPAPMILMYHRVATPACDPWDLSVAPQRFDEQMAVLRRKRTPLAMPEFVSRLRDGSLPRDAVAVTFDDGYVDNLQNAKPILAKHEVPATVFLTTDRLGAQVEYWWDELARLILRGETRVDGVLDLAGEPLPVKITMGAIEGDQEASDPWRAWDEPRNDREAAYYEVWNKLRPLPDDVRLDVMAQARLLFGETRPSAGDLPMTAGQVLELVDGGLIDVGGHTLTHPMLPRLPPEEQRREIVAGKKACEDMVGRRVPGFAYPYGEYDRGVRDYVEDSGFDWAVTVRSEAIRKSPNSPFELPRVQALDWDGGAFERAIARA